MQLALAKAKCKMHSQAMRSHADIIKGTGAEKIRERLGLSVHTVRSWAQRDSIPPEHWTTFEGLGWTTLAELAAGKAVKAAAARKDRAA
jgi:uncharacterized protein YjcR